MCVLCFFMLKLGTQKQRDQLLISPGECFTRNSILPLLKLAMEKYKYIFNNITTGIKNLCKEQPAAHSACYVYYQNSQRSILR